MENNSTGGNDKRSWRDRLGIGTKEMPRIAEEFKAVSGGAKPPADAPSPGAAKPAPRLAQNVVKPAPMAPRAAPKIEVRATPSQPAKQDAFAERLKSQREAAEKLAEQRVQAARQKAELAAAQRNQAKTPVPPLNTARPKYSFTDDADSKSELTELPALPRRVPARVTASVAPGVLATKPAATPSANLPPPRPALGMERPPLPPRPAVPVQPSQQTVVPQGSAYRSQEAMGSYVPPPPVFPQRQYTVPPVAPGRNLPPSAPAGRPPYYQGGNQPQMPDINPADSGMGEMGPGGRMVPRPTLRGPMSGPGGIPQGAYSDDIFEQAATRPQRRVSAGDYQNAYRDTDAGFEYEQPKSSGPWVLLLLLFLAGALAAAGGWFYVTQMKGQAIPIATQESVPAVEPPAASAKTEPEPPAAMVEQPVENAPEAAGGSVVPATTKKQIYDRIVGDREVIGGLLLPTEEVPVVPDEAIVPAESAEPPAEQPAITDDTAPLPLPPPPGQTGDNGQQGSLEAVPQAEKVTAEIPAASESQAADASMAQVVEPIAGEDKDVQGLAKAAEEIAAVQDSAIQAKSVELIAPPPALPPPQAATVETMAVPATAPVNLPGTSSESVGTETVSDEPAAIPSTPDAIETAKPELGASTAKAVSVEKPKAVKLPQKKKTVAVRKATSKPVVLIPAQKVGDQVVSSNNDTNVLYGETPALAPSAEKPAKRTLFDLLNNKKQQAAQPNTGTDQVASIAQPEKPKTARSLQKAAPEVDVTPPAGSRGGYVAQLASFRTEAEANNEFARVRTRHPTVVGQLSPVISQVTVAGSTRYRLAFGTMADRDAAGRVCAQLLAAGERDCVTKQR
jgi:SPOR domain